MIHVAVAVTIFVPIAVMDDAIMVAITIPMIVI